MVGSMLAGVISYQPAQAWMISLTDLTAWPVVSADNQLASFQHTWQC